MTKAKSVSLKQTKADTKKPSKAITVILPKHIALASEAGKQAKGLITFKEKLETIINALHKDKVIIGDARVCELAKAFLITRFQSEDKKPPSAAGKAKALWAFRYSVQTGKPYDENRGRDEKKAKAKKEKSESKSESENNDTDDMSIDTDSSFVLAIPKKGKAINASAELRKFINKMKSVDSYSALAGFLLDGLNEFEGE